MPQVAVIVTSPSLSAVTFPFVSTVAMLSSEDVQVTVLSVALSGVTVATSVIAVPASIVSLSLFKVIPVTPISPETTTSDLSFAVYCNTRSLARYEPLANVRPALNSNN